MAATSPIEKAIDAFGGVKRLAGETGIPEKTIYRWRAPKEVHGTGGMIPSDRQGIVLAAAQRLGLELTAADLVAMPDTAPAPATGGRA